MNRIEENILKATCRLFIREGVKNTTMDRIAGNAAVSKVTIYKYFKDKYSLCEQVNKLVLSAMIARMESIAASGDTHRKKLHDFIGCVTEFAETGQYGLCKDLARYGDAIEAEYGLYQRAYKNSMLALIDEGIRLHAVKEGLDRDMAFYFIDMGVSYYLQNPEYRNRLAADGAFREKFMSFYIGNIFCDGPAMMPVT